MEGGDEAKANLDAGRKDAEFVELLYPSELKYNSGNYFLHESTVKRFELTAESIRQIDYVGKYTEKSNTPERRPKQHAQEFKNFIVKGSDNVSFFLSFQFYFHWFLANKKVAIDERTNQQRR